MQQSEFGIHNVSVVGNSAPAGVDQSADYNAGDWIKKWGFPSDAKIFSISDIGPIAIGGPLVSAIAKGQVQLKQSSAPWAQDCGAAVSPGIMCPTMKLLLNPKITSSSSTVPQMR